MRYIEAPDRSYQGGELSVFLAGGITDCPDWQQDMVMALEDTTLVVLNPRRRHFPMDDPNAAREQIRWEHDHLRKAHAILFWFPQETLCPIVLYELGAWSMTDKPIFIGMDRNYARLRDVVLQTELVRPDVRPVSTLDNLAHQVISWARVQSLKKG